MIGYRPNVHWGKSRYQFAFRNLIGPRILSVGNIGSSDAWNNLLERFSEDGAEIWGLDVDKDRALELPRPAHARQVVGDAENLPFGENTFSSIWMGQILEHLYQPFQTISLAYRALTPGGVLVLDTPNVFSLGRIIQWLLRGEDKMLGEPSHLIFYSFTAVQVLLKNAGFENIQLASDGKISFGFATSKIKLTTVPYALRFLERFGAHILAAAVKPGESQPPRVAMEWVCPISRQKLENRGSRLVTPDQKYQYPVLDGIPCLRPKDALTG